MKKILVIWLALVGLLLAGEKPVTYSEVENTLKDLQEAMKAGQEQLVTLYSATLEVVKKATVPSRATEIFQRIRARSRISAADFRQMREQFSFPDLVIAYGVSRQAGEKMKTVLAWRAEKTWTEIFQQKSLSSAVDRIAACLSELVPAGQPQ
ncbi:MAG TPA: hypothetical protein PKX93_00410 [bacterium]|nr:hypothetical protein [bacterium]HPP12476.1 hypothetical protein [bacterium]